MNLDPRAVAAALPDEVHRTARLLIYSPAAYFETATGPQTVPLDRLRLTRARPEGIASAVSRMAEAAAGTRLRRAPVNVRLREDGAFDVLDGNSTVVAAAAAGWPDLPCTVEQEAAG